MDLGSLESSTQKMHVSHFDKYFLHSCSPSVGFVTSVLLRTPHVSTLVAARHHAKHKSNFAPRF